MRFPGDAPIQSGNRTAEDHKDWLADLVEALENTQFALSNVWEGVEGCIKIGANFEDYLRASSTNPASLQVQVSGGVAIVSSHPVWIRNTTTLTFVAPVTNPRIDLIQVSLTTRTISAKAGPEAVAPVAPEPDLGALGLFQVYHQPGESCIFVAEDPDGRQGHLIDAREWLELRIASASTLNILEAGYDAEATLATGDWALVHDTSEGENRRFRMGKVADFVSGNLHILQAEYDANAVPMNPDYLLLHQAASGKTLRVPYSSFLAQVGPYVYSVELGATVDEDDYLLVYDRDVLDVRRFTVSKFLDVLNADARLIHLTAQGLTPAITNGCSIPTAHETTFFKNVYWGADFAPDAEQSGFWGGGFLLPVNCDGGPFKFRVIWTAEDVGAGGCVRWKFGLSLAQIAMDTGRTEAAVMDDVFQSDKVLITPWTDLDKTSTGDRFMIPRITRDATHAEDTLAVPARLLGVEIAYQGQRIVWSSL